MEAGTIRLGIDFMFEAAKAMGGMQKVTHGFNNISSAAESFTKAAKSATIETALMDEKLTANFKKVMSDMIRGDEATRLLGKSLRGLKAGNFGTQINAEVGELYQAQKGALNIIDGVSESSAKFVANAVAVEKLSEIVDSTESLAKAFENMGIKSQKGSSNLKNFSLSMTKLAQTDQRTYKSLTQNIQGMNQFMKELNPKHLAIFRTELENLNKDLDGGQVNLKQYNRQLGAIEERAKMSQGFDDFKKNLHGNIISALALGAVFNNVIEAQKKLNQSVISSGLATSQALKGVSVAGDVFMNNETKAMVAMQNTAIDVGTTTGVSMARASEAISALAQQRVSGTIGDMKELGTVTIQMEQAFGLSEGAAVGLIKQLHVIGGIKTENIRGVADKMAKVQKVYGLTAEEATEVAATTGKIISKMSSLSANAPKNVGVVIEEVSKMTATFTRAGLSTQDATEMLDKFMDPDKIADNALLWSKMGISVGDAMDMMNGDGSKMIGMTDKMGKAANDLMQQYGGKAVALKQMSEAYGMTTQQVKQLSSEYVKQSKLTDKEKKSLADQATLESASAAQRKNLADQTKKFMDTLQNFMAKVLMPIINVLTTVMEAINGVIGVIHGIPVLGPILATLAGGFLVVGAAVAMFHGNIFKMLPLVGKLGGVLKDFASSALGLAGKGIAALSDKTGILTDKLGSAAKATRLANKEKAAANKLEAATAKAESAGSKASAAAPKGKSGFLEGLKNIPPQTLLALAVAILAVGAAIGIIALSFAVLANALKQLNPDQLNALMVMTIAIMAGFVLAMVALAIAVAILGNTGAEAAPGIIALAVALIAMGVAIAIIVLSVAVLAAALSLLAGKDILIPLLELIAGLALLVVLAILVSSLAAPITIGAVVLAILAASILILAIAMLLGALAIKMFIDAIMSMDPVKFAANIGVLGASLFAIIPAIFAFAAALGILGLALVGFVLAAVPGLIGLIGVAVAVGIFGLALAWLNGILTGIVGNFTALQGALVTLTQLGTNLPIIADSLSKLGDALKSSSEKFAPFVNSFSVLSGMIGPLLLLSLVMGNLAESVAKMGNGMQMFSNNIAAVMKGLSDMVTFVKANGSNFAENFATQIDKVSQSFAKMAAISPLIALTGMISGVSNNNNNVQAQANPGAQDLTPIIKEVQEMNAKLTDIRDNTKGTVDKLTELIRITRSGSAWQPTMTTGKS